MGSFQPKYLFLTASRAAEFKRLNRAESVTEKNHNTNK